MTDEATSAVDATHYLVIDLEATCASDQSIPRDQTEIIEIGAVMVDAATLRAVDEFGTFVRPVVHPLLNSFCRELTTIRQEDVDGAPTLGEAITSLVEWASRRRPFLFCSWGAYDRNQLLDECRRKGVDYPFDEGHLNLKQRFAERRNLRRGVGMARALALVGLSLDGEHHRGIDDARNIARLLPYIVR